MSKIEFLAVADREGIERPAMLIARHGGIGVTVDWLRTGRQEIVHPERVRTVDGGSQEWDLACEWDAFSGSCFKCGQVKQDPRPFGACPSCLEAQRKPQGEPVRLFEPAPTQITGQQGMML